MRTLFGLGAIGAAFYFAWKCFTPACPGDVIELPSSYVRNPQLRDLFDHSTKKPVFGLGVPTPVNQPVIVSNPVQLAPKPKPTQTTWLGTAPQVFGGGSLG